MLHRCVFLLSVALASSQAAVTQADDSFSFAKLKKEAAALAAVPHVPPKRVAERFLKLDYDNYRHVAANRDNALFRDKASPFWAEFFPAGSIFEYPVEMNVVDESGKVERLTDGPKWFQFRGPMKPLENEPGIGFSGFRLLAQLAGNPEMDEFVVFQGASYFRGRVAPYGYGASARALAVDVGLPSPEEFPRFTKVWIERPKADAKQARVWALMDSPAEAGACEFLITPGKPLSIHVEVDVWFRHKVQKVGIAPLTSMWMWDGSSVSTSDSRPEVHDSDGLLIHSTGGDWTWRPLDRPKAPRVSKVSVANLAGFGLLQRDRDFEHYRDNEAKYHERPSVWVTPEGDWGPGHVELLELPAESEGVDNIGAYWVSDKPITAGSHISTKYRLTFGEEPAEQLPEWHVFDTRVKSTNDSKTFEIEFRSVDQQAATVMPTPKVTCDGGTIEGIQTLPNKNGGLVVRFVYHAADAKTAHIQAQLHTETGTVSENWSYLWTRN